MKKCGFGYNAVTKVTEHNCFFRYRVPNSSTQDSSYALSVIMVSAILSLWWQFASLLHLRNSSYENNPNRIGQFIGWLVGSGIGFLTYYPIKATFESENNKEFQTGYTVASTLAAVNLCSSIGMLAGKKSQAYLNAYNRERQNQPDLPDLELSETTYRATRHI